MGLPPSRLKTLKGLKTPNGRRERGSFLIDGRKLITEAIKANAPIREVFAVDPGDLADLPSQITPISRADAERLSDLKTPQGVFAEVDDCTIPSAEAISRIRPGDRFRIVALDRVQDPANAGAIVRSAAAFGCDAVLFGPDCADPVHPRVLRAATAAWFRIPIWRSAALASDLAEIKGKAAFIYGTKSGGQTHLPANTTKGRTVYVFGNEGAGLSEEVKTVVGDLYYSISLGNQVESLNVGVAAGIILWHICQTEGF